MKGLLASRLPQRRAIAHVHASVAVRQVVDAAVANASQVWWQERALWCLWILEWGSDAALTTDLLSPNTKDDLSMGTPRCCKARHKSMICSAQVWATTHSEPKVVVSKVVCNLSTSTNYLVSHEHVQDASDRTSTDEIA